jgi:hypothetical protein
MAESGSAILYQFGVGLAFLATTRRDGGPRVHPICPQLYEAGLYAFIIPSPKRDDLFRDGRYALHSFPRVNDEDAFYLMGRARAVRDAELRRGLVGQFVEERSAQGIPGPGDDQILFAFDLERCLLTRTSGHGDPAPQHVVWRAG